MKEIGSFVKPSIEAKKITYAEGYHIYSDGKKWIDTMSGLWCVPLGYSNDQIKTAMRTQLDLLPYYNNYFETQCDITERYAEALCEEARFDRAYFSNSGAEAVETAIKIAHHNRPTGKCMVFKNSYHGASVLSGYTSDYDLHTFHKMKAPIEVHLWDGKKIPEDMSFVLIEPVICAGGVRDHSRDTWAAIYEYQKKGGIVIFDEIVTGFGKTGTMFAKDWVGMEPDMMTLGKAITNGYVPFAATLINERLLPKSTFEHGYTCSGHPVAARAAMAALLQYQTMEFADDYIGYREFKTIKEAVKFKAHMYEEGYIVEYSSSDIKRVVYCLPYILPEDEKKKFHEHFYSS